MDDEKILQDYVQTGSQNAFRALVNRHIALVYSAALRMMRDSTRAESVTQTVFVKLARKADAINPSDVLARWLYDTVRREAAHAQLSAGEQGTGRAAATMTGQVGGTAGVTAELEAMMDRLPPPDRDAIVLRYLENRSLPEVAEILRVSEEAAQARVSHAVNRLDADFKARGLPIAAPVLEEVLTSECAAHVPVGLAIAISTEALEAAAADPARYSTGSWWNGRTAAGVVVALLVASAGVVLWQSARVRQLRSDNDRLVAEQRKFKPEPFGWRPTLVRDGDLELVRLHRSENEVLRLRRELAQLRQQAQASAPQVSAAPDTPPVNVAPGVPHDPGTLIERAELGFSGYSTPEAAMESIVWCMVAGNYDAYLTALTADDRADELEHPENRATFEARQQQLAAQFGGMQVAAMKEISDDEVELKVLLEVGSPRYYIQPLVRINDQWRLSSSSRDYDPNWDNDGEVQQFVPTP